MPHPHKEIVRRGYDAASERYRADDDDPPEYSAWLRELDSLLPTRSRVLDLGCGCGVPVARTLAQHGHEVIGVDISAVQIERARRLVPTGRFIRSDASALSFGAASFEAVVCLYMLIHLPYSDQRALIGDVHTWLRPGGLLLATVGATAFTGEQADWLGGGGLMWWNHPDADTYREWLTSAGLTIGHDEFVPEGNGGHQLLVARKN